MFIITAVLACFMDTVCLAMSTGYRMSFPKFKGIIPHAMVHCSGVCVCVFCVLIGVCVCVCVLWCCVTCVCFPNSRHCHNKNTVEFLVTALLFKLNPITLAFDVSRVLL